MNPNNVEKTLKRMAVAAICIIVALNVLAFAVGVML